MVVAGHAFGLLAALLYVCLLVVIYVLRDRWPLFRHLAGRKAYLISISIVLFLLLVFGLVPQDGGRDGLWGVLGFRNMNRSPLFILALLFLTTVLALNAIEDIHKFSRHRLGVTCAHVGLSVILVGGIFGGRVTPATVSAMRGTPVRQGVDEWTGNPIRLPFELTLRSFSIDEYSSEVTLTLPDGHSVETRIAVNHPLKVGSWWVYQTDYQMDTEKGTFASVFKCVHSPLSEVFRIALWMMMLAAAAMVFFSGFKPRFGSAGKSHKDKEERQ